MSTLQRPRMLTGDRPTGRLHLGHYVGTLANRIRLQSSYESYFIVADLHMLTTKNSPEDIARVDENAHHLVLDAISAGIDPDQVTFYLQSAIPEIHELAGLLQSLVTVSRLERVPSLKDMARDAGIDMSFALLGYPVLQAADILSVRAQAVPVGKDNFAHVEISRELARRFNSTYDMVFPVPELVPSDVPSLIGTDGEGKMSKSKGNSIDLQDDEATVRRKVKRMYTDPNRISADIPGTVEGNPVFAYLDAFDSRHDIVAGFKRRYEAGQITDTEVKERLALVLDEFLNPMRERRLHVSQPGVVEQILVEGTARVRIETQATVLAMRQAMGLAGVWNRMQRKARTVQA
ncbi:MAG: tryptophan--tRNA ligase [Thermomicrobiales bacterium]